MLRNRNAGLRFALAALTCVAMVAGAQAAELRPHTLKGFERYVRLTEARLQGELAGSGSFLWVHSRPDRADLHAQLQAGRVVVAGLETRDRGKTIDIQEGLRHHWVGTVFIPGVTLERTVAMVQDYHRYPEIYQPNVRTAKILSRNGDRFRVSMQMFMKKIVSVVLNAEYDVQYVRVSPTRLHVRSSTTRIAEVEDADTPRQHEKPVGNDSGFLWRFHNYCSFEQRGGGTYMQCESVSLTRDIPAGLGWLVRPFVNSVPVETLTQSLEAARRYLVR